MAKPDDDFIDITAPAGNPASATAPKTSEVDFDIGAGAQETRAAANTEPVDYTKTMIMRKPPVPKASADTDHAATKATGATPVAPPRATPPSAGTDAPAASGGARLWVGIAVAVIAAIVVWWVMRR